MTIRLIHWGSRAFKFEYIDNYGRFCNIEVLKPFANLKKGDKVSGICMNMFTFECYWWEGPSKHAFNMSELMESQDAEQPQTPPSNRFYPRRVENALQVLLNRTIDTFNAREPF